MVTRNELVYDIFESLRAHIGDDDDIDIRQLEVYVKDYRAEFLKQRFEKDPFAIDASVIQHTGVLSVEKVDSSLLPAGSGYQTSNKSILKTTLKVPNTIRRIGHIGTWTHIGSADLLDSSFTLKSYTDAIDSGHGRFNRDEVFVFLYNEYLYFISKGDTFKTIYNIVGSGVFSDPREAYLLANNTTIYTGDENYYTPRDLKARIIASILKDKYGLVINPPVDNTDDGNHELEGSSQPAIRRRR